jgi:hypothetical protein
MCIFLRAIQWTAVDPEELKEPSSVEGILMELSAEGWPDKTPVARLLQDARALERFLSECISGNSRVALQRKIRTTSPCI